MTKIFRRKTLDNRIPILKWMKQYKAKYLISDIIAGCSVGLTVVPQSLAYATVAGLPPQYGLYAAFMGCFIYVFLGSTRSLTLGPVALLSISIYPTVAKFGPVIATFLCFMSGIVELLLGLFNLGFFLDFISAAVVDGFSSAAAITIASTQLKGLFGLKFNSVDFLETWIGFFNHIQESRLGDTVMGFSSIVFLLLLRKLGQIQIPKKGVGLKILSKFFWLLSTARNAICVFICTGISAAIYDPVTNKSPFLLIGNITAGLPAFSPPNFEILNGTSGEVIMDFKGLVKETGVSLIILPLIGILEAVAIAKSFARGQKVDASQEMIAIGVSNIVSSFVSSFPVTGSFSRTAVNESSGVRSPLGGIITGTIVLLAAALLTPYFFYIPKASLAAVIITAVILMVEYHVILPMWRTKKMDLIPLFTTFFMGLFLGLELGILVGTGVHLLMMSFGNARPPIHVETVKKYDQTYVIIRPKDSLVFPSADYFSAYVRKVIRKSKAVDTVVFDLAFVTRMDFAAAKTLKNLSTELSKMELNVVATNLNPRTRQVLEGIKPKNLNVI